MSVGYACYPVDGYDCATLLACADSKMYNDKTDRDLARLATGSATGAVPVPALPAFIESGNLFSETGE